MKRWHKINFAVVSNAKCYFFFSSLMNTEWMDLHLVQSLYVCFFPSLMRFFKTTNAVLESVYKQKNHAYYNHNNKTKTNSSSNHFNSSPHIKPKTGKCFAALTEQGPGVRGQGSAWFPSEQICKNKYITCPIIHSVAEWQSGAFFFFFP